LGASVLDSIVISSPNFERRSSFAARAAVVGTLLDTPQLSPVCRTTLPRGPRVWVHPRFELGEERGADHNCRGKWFGRVTKPGKSKVKTKKGPPSAAPPRTKNKPHRVTRACPLRGTPEQSHNYSISTTNPRGQTHVLPAPGPSHVRPTIEALRPPLRAVTAKERLGPRVYRDSYLRPESVSRGPFLAPSC
jgi:hypothetical protein